MKYFIPLSLCISLLILSCNSGQNFNANQNNPLMVGKWKITKVDQADAVSSKETLALSFFEQYYEEGAIFHFSDGPDIVLLSKQEDTLFQGEYGIADEDSQLKLYSPSEDKISTYKIEKKNDNRFRLNNQTTGEFTNLNIEKME